MVQGRRILRSLWVSILVAMMPSGVWGQASKGYLATCKPLECDQGLTCALTAGQSTGICVHECNLLQPRCPKGETCSVQANGAGACLCTGQECAAPMTCNDRQCSGLLRWNDGCDQNRPCGRGLVCVAASDEKVGRCRPLCSGATCATGEACVAIDPSDLQSFRFCLCASNDECPQGSACQAGRCQAGLPLGEVCSAQRPCNASLVCARIGTTVSDTSCVARCSNKRCVGGESCQALTGGAEGCICSDALPCPVGLTCQRGLCIRSSTPLCNSVFSCPAGSFCIRPFAESDLGLCLPGCSAQGTCTNGSPCITLAHSKVCGCTEDSQCSSGSRCIASQCTRVCGSVNDCLAGQICRAGRCIADPEATPEVVPETTDGSTSDTPREFRPSLCNPPCQEPFRCTNGICTKLDIADDCATNDQCESGFCFGRDKGRKICSPTDCTKCQEYGLTCQSFESGSGCFFRPSTTPDASTPSSCNCQALSPWQGGFFFLLLLFLWPARRRS